MFTFLEAILTPWDEKDIYDAGITFGAIIILPCVAILGVWAYQIISALFTVTNSISSLGI
jgi:peptidoglycan biosynthesis protein MviN/MurJ (putative lipid II flippase)